MTAKSSNESIEAKLAKHNKTPNTEKAEKKEEIITAEAPPVMPKLDHTAYEELMTRLNEAEQKNSQYWDQILRMKADMENASRRAERDKVNAHKFALEQFLTELLPVIDNLERAISAAQESKVDASAILEGVNLTLKMLYNVLDKAGVQQVNPINEPFNPSYHEAVSMQAGPKPGLVLSVLQKGYILNERLVRPALVIVSK